MSASIPTHDLLVIGGGPGGYVCAIRAAQLGMNVGLVEKRKTIGGTCVNVGCIPSKALLDSSHKYHESCTSLSEHGIHVGNIELDLKQMMARKSQVVKELTDGLDYLMKKNRISLYEGLGSLESVDDGNVTITIVGKKEQEVRAKYCVIATGSESIPLPNIAIDSKNIINSDHAISLDSIPKKLVIIGGGVIGLELGSVWSRLGAEVTIVEALPSILMSMDRQLRDAAMRILKSQGLRFLCNHKVVQALVGSKRVAIIAENEAGQSVSLDADKLLVSVGRRPYTNGLGAEKVGLKINARGRIEVNAETLVSNVPNIYAIGDVIEGAMLAHRAEEEGVMIAERLAGKPGHVNYSAIPWVVYTWPEIAWVGRSEEELKSAGISYNVGRHMYKANGRAKAMNETDGQVKILADKHTDKILGVFIIGANASELIAESTLAVEFGASAEDIARSFHAHPTLAETVREAALDVDKRALHA